MAKSSAQRQSEYRARNLEKIRARERAIRISTPERLEAAREKSRKWYAENSERAIETSAQWKKDNPEKSNAHAMAWRNENREKHRAISRNWAANNRPKVLAVTKKRKAAAIKATPAWANQFFMEEAYILAALRTKLTGVEWHVDHIVPLRSKLVCGLHWEKNMAVITAKENSEKGNRWWPDMPEVNRA